MMTRPTSKLPAAKQPAPKPRDPLPWWAGLIAAPVLATVVRLVATRFPAIPHVGLVVGTAAVAIVWRTPFITKRFRGVLYGRGRTGCTIAAIVGCSIAIAGFWQADGWWNLTLVALLVWVTTAIGGGGNIEQLRERFRMAHATVTVYDDHHADRAVHDADRCLKVFRAELATKFPNAKVGAPSRTSDGFALMVNSDVPIQTATLAWIAGRAYGYPQNDILVADLSYEGRTGTYKVVIGAPKLAEQFTQPLKPRPAVGEWPDGMVPIGEYGDGSVCYIGRGHVTIGAETGAGKSWLLENIVWGNLVQGWIKVVLLDPKRVAFGKYRDCANVDAYANEPAAMVAQLERLSRRMDSRYKTLELAGRDKWTVEDGPFLLCVVDETFDLVTQAPEAVPHLVRLYQLGRAAGIQMVCATQRPDAQSIPPLVKANSGSMIGLRVANATAERTLWEDAKDRGVKLNDRGRPDGRAYVETVGREGADVQIYPTPGATGLVAAAQPAPPDQPTTPQAPYAGRSTVDPVDPVEVDSTRSTQPEPPTTALDLYAGKDTRTIILEALDNEPITGEALALIAQVSPQAVSKHMQKLLEDGLAKRARGGWVRA